MNQDEYHDTRADLPVHLTRDFAGWTIEIVEDRSTGAAHFNVVVWRQNSPIFLKASVAQLSMAKTLVEDFLDVCAIRIRTTPDAERKGEGRPVLVR